MGLSGKKTRKFQAWYLGVIITLLFCISNVLHTQELSESSDGQSSGFIGTLERVVFDYRIRSRGTRPMSNKVGLLAIDEKSIAKFGRWPFSRNAYPQALKNLKAAGVKWIGFDAIFSEPENISLNDALEPLQDVLAKSMTPTGLLNPKVFVEGVAHLVSRNPADQSFGKSIAEFENIIQACVFIPEEQAEGLELDWDKARKAVLKNRIALVDENNVSESRTTGNIYPLINTSLIAGPKPILGFINNSPDLDGLMRRNTLIHEIPAAKGEDVKTQKQFVPNLGLQLAARYLNRKIKVSLNDYYVERISLVDDSGNDIVIPMNGRQGTALINHYGEHTTAAEKTTPTTISLADAAENNLPKEIPDVLILGSTIIGADDRRPSPLNGIANGVEHHIAVVENIIRQDFLKRPLYYVINEVIFTFISGFLLCLLLIRASALVSLIILISTHVLLEVIDRKFIFGANHVYNFGIFHLQNATIFISMTLYKYFIEEREKRQIKGAFQHYLNPSVINQLLESPEGLKLGGQKRELTVFFSDVRGFTSISELLAPEALASLLNEYFTPMTNIVLDSGGLLDKYIGDALMAVWGAPLPQDDHADRALLSALKMLDALDGLQAGWKTRNLPVLDIGCGINTGPMVVGNMGSNLRFDYTVLGDSVNLGSRLEGITKEYGVKIICSENTKKALKNPDNFLLRELDWIRVKGKNEHVTIYEVMRFQNENKIEVQKICDTFQAGLKKYRERAFDDAQFLFMQILKTAPQDGPASVFLERCEYFLEHPANENWDGIWVMKSK